MIPKLLDSTSFFYHFGDFRDKIAVDMDFEQKKEHTKGKGEKSIFFDLVISTPFGVIQTVFHNWKKSI